MPGLSHILPGSWSKSPPAPPPLPRPLPHHPRAAAPPSNHHKLLHEKQQQHELLPGQEMATYTIEGPVCMERHLRFFLHGQLRASEAALEACILSTASFLRVTIIPYMCMINSSRHYCRSNRIALQRTGQLCTRRFRGPQTKPDGSTLDGRRQRVCPTRTDSCARISSTSGDIVAARWRRAWWRTSTKSESNLEVGLPRTVRQQPTFGFLARNWRQNVKSFRMRQVSD